jgi:hypothetical protein
MLKFKNHWTLLYSIHKQLEENFKQLGDTFSTLSGLFKIEIGCIITNEIEKLVDLILILTARGPKEPFLKNENKCWKLNSLLKINKGHAKYLQFFSMSL